MSTDDPDTGRMGTDLAAAGDGATGPAPAGSDAPIRWGICGTGAIVERFLRELASVPDAAVVAVCSRSGERAAEFAHRWGIDRAHEGVAALAGDDGVDVVYVASTQERHRLDTVTLLEGGRHVLCEKPFALTLADAQAMCDAAVAADRFLMEALWSRFLPSYEALAALLAEGSIGEPQLLEANFSFRLPAEALADHRLADPARGGGALFDLGVWPVQLAHLVFGPPDTVEAVATMSPNGIDTRTSLLLGWDGGAGALLHASIDTVGTLRARVMGSGGVIDLAAPMHCTDRLTITRGFDVEERSFPAASLHFQVLEVHRCLRAGRRESGRMPHSTTLEIMAVLDEASRRIGLRYPPAPTV